MTQCNPDSIYPFNQISTIFEVFILCPFIYNSGSVLHPGFHISILGFLVCSTGL